jgi:Zn-dependent protease with chaperone function
MFGNFIYFIVVLLIYSSYQPSEETNFSYPETLFLFTLLIALFAGVTRMLFARIERRMSQTSPAQLDPLFHAALTRQSVLAIVLFALNVYGLNLPSFFVRIRMFQMIPTALSLIFLGLFISFLAIVWACAYGSYQRIYRADLSRRSYILSNISFSIPVILPWLMLSGVADVINVLPFELPKRILSTTEGEIAYFLLFLFGVAVFGPVIIQKFWRCKPLEDGFERKQIEHLCRKAGMSYANILQWPLFGGRMITAGVMGLIRKFRYILVTDALLRYLRPEEIDAVIAHEIGHVKRNHLLFYLFFFIGYLLISYASFDLIIFAILYAKPLHRVIEWSGVSQTAAFSAVFSLVIILLFLFYFRYVFGYFMRNFERQADIYVYELFDDAQPLISTFRKIAAASGQSPDRPNWHHFSINERIGYLERCESDKRWIAGHHRKIHRSIAVYLVGLFVIGIIGFQLNFGKTGKRLNTHFFETILQREIEKSPNEPDLHGMLGDLYYSDQKLDKAVGAYERTLGIDSENPRVLNNLAWLYATTQDDAYRNPERALSLAKKAARLEPAPHVLDTLAESYFANGAYEEAIEAERRAVAIAKTNHAYYKDQLKKFIEAAEGKVQ